MASTLGRALHDGDGPGARRAVQRLRQSADDDAVLDELAAFARSGDLLAVELLVEEVDRSEVAARFVGMLLLDPDDVQEATQDVLVAVAASISTYRGDSRFTTWLHPIARRRAVDHLRRKRQTVALGDDDLGDSRRMSSMIASRESIRTLLNRLPDTYREPVALHDVDGMT